MRTDAASGTQSTDTLARTRIGIFYLSTDNYIRNIGPRVTYSSGEYSLGDSGSPIVSYDINDDLINLVDLTQRDNAQAIFFDDKYILSFESVNNSSNYNDLTYFADTSKFNQFPGVEQLQPYWGEFTGFDYDFFAIQTSGNQEKFYGAKGESGAVQESLNDSINNDNSAAICTNAKLGWIAIGGEGLYKRVRQVYFSGQTENWDINLVFNVYRLGENLPGDGEGISYSYSTSSISGGTVGTAVVGTDVVGITGVSSQRYGMNLTGHYFTAEFKNENADEFTRVIKLVVYFKPIKQS